MVFIKTFASMGRVWLAHLLAVTGFLTVMKKRRIVVGLVRPPAPQVAQLEPRIVTRLHQTVKLISRQASPTVVTATNNVLPTKSVGGDLANV
jgi:hypothetical protein